MHKPVPKEHTSPHATNVGIKSIPMCGASNTPKVLQKGILISFIMTTALEHIEPMSPRVKHSHSTRIMSRKSETLTQYKNYEPQE